MEITINALLQEAIAAHQIGKLQDAERLYRAILQNEPKHPDANHNLGILAVSLRRPELALPLFKIALEAKPSQSQFWISYIDALIKTNQLQDAKSVLNQGKKLGLEGERVDALEIQLTPAAVEEKNKIILQEKSSGFKQKHRQVIQKKGEKKKKNVINKKSIPTQSDIDLLLSYYQKGQYDNVEKLAKIITQSCPEHPFAWKALGTVLQKTARIKESLIPNQKAVELSPKDATAHSNLGNSLKELGRLEDALGCYNKALILNPEYAEAHYNTGITLQELGRTEDAVASYKKALMLKPDFGVAYINLGNSFQELGRLEDAVACYKNALAIKPDFALAQINLGNTVKELGRLEDAVACYKNALAIKPDFAEAYVNLAITLREQGRFEDAFDTVRKCIKIKLSVEVKKLFINISKQLNIQSWDQSLAQLVVTALLEPWGRPTDLMAFSCRLIKTDKELVRFLSQLKDCDGKINNIESISLLISKEDYAASSLLYAMLSSGPIADADIEISLTSLRYYLLRMAAVGIWRDDVTNDVPTIYYFLAQQCFINEYVYFQTSEEIDLSHHLRVQIIKALEDQKGIPELWVIALACYFPIFSVTGAKKLLQYKWSKKIESVLRQQLLEPLEEINLRASIPILTYADNRVSLAVQSQYEENPYPRWVRLPNESNKKTINAYIQNKFPLASFRRLANKINPEMLIAGCGTGQHSIESSQAIKDTKTLAVDLSVASLAYAKRKTIELGIDTIEYAQADLLKLGSVGRTFDVIQSAGVLHHLDKPFEGWEILLSLLRPNGLMMLAFYSEIARRDIVRVRNLISKEGIGSSSQEIRDYRKYLLISSSSVDYGFATNSSDFFSASNCRDLLFHAQEHRMTIPILANFLKEHNLNFLGFEVDALVKRSYLSCFPNDPAATDLNNWNTYEQENPDTFLSMYQFWIQKNT
jgi:tetratricopeptide (TPR) repeat protein/2-polyprenyl-3-methyl-5-hydroxy-6-metoxy-1,4-benzoquinol methylase